MTSEVRESGGTPDGPRSSLSGDGRGLGAERSFHRGGHREVEIDVRHPLQGVDIGRTHVHGSAGPVF